MYQKNRKTNEIFGSRLKGVHEEIYNFHIVPLRPQNYSICICIHRKMLYINFLAKQQVQQTGSNFFGEREKGNEHFHMKINLRAHHYVELFENKFCSAVQQLPFLTACLRCYFVSIFFSIDIFSMVSLPLRRIFGGNSSKLQNFFLRNFLSKLFIKNLHKSP